MTATSKEWVTLEVSDGTSMDAFVASPADEHNLHAGVIVLQEIWGVNAHIRDVANRFAHAGYTAIAPDVFHRTAGKRFEAPYTEFTGREHWEKLTRAGAQADLTATFEWLHERLLESSDSPFVASCGFCMGGRLSFVANGALPLNAAISFYGGGIAQKDLDLAASQSGPLLLFWAGRDKHITKEHRRAVADALESADKVFTEVNVGYADHGFFCDQRSMFDPKAAKQAWELVLSFLKAQNPD